MIVSEGWKSVGMLDGHPFGVGSMMDERSIVKSCVDILTDARRRLHSDLNLFQMSKSSLVLGN